MFNRLLIPALLILLVALACTAEVQIAAVGNAEVAPGLPILATPSDMIHLRFASLPWSVARAQLIVRNGPRDWVVASEAELVSSRTADLAMPLPSAGCDRGPIEVAALITRSGVRKGHVFAPADVAGMRYVSRTVSVSCPPVKGTIRILSISHQAVRPGYEIHVGHVEQIRIAYEGVPDGTFLQLLIAPDDAGGLMWAMPDFHQARSIRGIEEFTGYFGRASEPAAREQDLYRTFRVFAVLTRRPLPVHGESSMAAAELQEFSGAMVALSQPVRAVRSLPRDGLSIRIDNFGSPDFGDLALVHGFERVEGLVTAGPDYHPQKVGETVTLLIRAGSKPVWKVAGATHLRPNDLTKWVITLAALTPGGPASQGENHAMAAIFPGNIDVPGEVTDAVLDHAIALSDEIRYRVIGEGGNQ